MLANTPILFILVGLAAYTVLAGADFGTGFWILVFRGETAVRDYARRATGPVWEANHVWLIFVLVVCWTAYPIVFASIVSTLTVPIFVAAIGIILRGAAYALRAQLQSPRQKFSVENIFALSSLLTPFAMGAAVGSIASGRVPVGNAAGDLITSWLNPTSAMIGILAVATSSYLAAVYLAADAHRTKDWDFQRKFRHCAVGAGLVTGTVALAGLAVVRFDDFPLWQGLTSRTGLMMIGVSAAAGAATLALDWQRYFGAARVTAALAVVAVLIGWAIAQQPYLLPGLTLEQAAAGRSTLIAVVISVTGGIVLLIPSLLLLFSLLLRGRLDPMAGDFKSLPHTARSIYYPSRLIGGFVLASLLFGASATVFADGWAQAVGISCLCASAIPAFAFAATAI